MFRMTREEAIEGAKRIPALFNNDNEYCIATKDGKTYDIIDVRDKRFYENAKGYKVELV